jgi:hypothetical protein
MLALEAFELALEQGLSACLGARCGRGSCRRCRSRADPRTAGVEAQVCAARAPAALPAVEVEEAAAVEVEEAGVEAEVVGVEAEVVGVEAVAEAVGVEAVAVAVAAEAGAGEVAAVEEILHEKAPDVSDGRGCRGQPLAPELPIAAPASGRRRARSSGWAGLAWPHAQPASTEVAFRSRRSWAPGRKAVPAPAGRPRRLERPAARVRHARNSPRSKP